MVLNSQQTLAVSTAVASIASAALLTLIGWCIPYTERNANGSADQQADGVQPALSLRATQAPRQPGERGARGSAPASQRAGDAAAQH